MGQSQGNLEDLTVDDADMSVLSYLQSLAGDALHLPREKAKVQEALLKLQERLTQHFGNELEQHFKFGSAVRGTNLPQQYAEEMDIDYLVVFRERGLTPKTLLRKLVDFAQLHYRRNEVFQSSPAVVVVMRSVRFELVPARRTLTGIFHSHEIPNAKANDWIGSNPLGFEHTLIERNKACHNQLKAAIRLVKIWNAENGYVFSSFRLENIANDLSYPWDKNLKHYFCRLLLELPESELDADWRLARLQRGKKLLTEVLSLEESGNVTSAIKLLDRLFGND